MTIPVPQFPSSRNAPARALAVAAGFAATLASITGCKGSGDPNSGSSADTGREVNTGLASLAGGSDADSGMLTLNAGEAIDKDDPGALAMQAAADLESLLKSGDLDPTKQPPVRSARRPSNDSGIVPAPISDLAPAPADGTTDPVHIPLADGDALAAADREWSEQANTTPPTAAATHPLDSDPKSATTDERLVALASRIASFIRDPVPGSDGKPSVAEAVVLAPLEALAPGSLASIDNPSSVLGSRLSLEDRKTLAAARDRMASAPLVTAETIAESLRAIAPPTQVRIPRALLCTRVSGFGKFEPFASNSFVAGTAARAIVYAEVDGFTYRAARAGDPLKPGEMLSDQQSVELEQTLTLYQDVDGYQAWHKPAQKVIEVSRTRRRDFYLIQVVEFPAALAIGKYNLKITIRDVTSGAVAETVVPIEMRSSLASAE